MQIIGQAEPSVKRHCVFISEVTLLENFPSLFACVTSRRQHVECQHVRRSPLIELQRRALVGRPGISLINAGGRDWRAPAAECRDARRSLRPVDDLQ